MLLIMLNAKILAAIDNAAPGKVFLVGGSVRDLLLGCRPRDIDLAFSGSARDLVFKLAAIMDIRPLVLDDEHDIMRAVFAGGYVDIAGLGAGGLENDLRRRDFTINAMALSLGAHLQGEGAGAVIDPLGGVTDLRRGVIRACSSSALEDDPLRLLRALRFRAGLGFKIAPGTIGLMRNLQQPLSTVPGERVWEELRRILELPGSAQVFHFLHYELNVLRHIFPELAAMESTEQNHYHAHNVWKHCLQTLFEWEGILRDGIFSPLIKKRIQEYLYHPFFREKKRLPLIKLACLFHDVGKPETRGLREDGRITFYGHQQAGGPIAEKIGCRLRMSKAERKLLRRLVEAHMQPLFLYKNNSPTDKALFRFFLSLGPETPGCLLLSLADISSSRKSTGRHDLAEDYREYISKLLERYEKEKDGLLNTPGLLSGNEIRNILSLPPGPLVGKIKEKLWEAQVEGKISSRQEAVEYVREVYLSLRAD